MKFVPVQNSTKMMIVDDEDFKNCSSQTWYLVTRSIQARLVDKNVSIASYILGICTTRRQVIDHIDRDPFNNQKSNLRVCSVAENNRNRKKQRTNTSGYKGVTWDKSSNKWLAQIQVDGKNIHLGRFEDKIEAAKVYNSNAVLLYGQFAVLNKIEE